MGSTVRLKPVQVFGAGLKRSERGLKRSESRGSAVCSANSKEKCAMSGGSVEGDLRFGRVVIAPGARRLAIDGQPCAIGARAFDVLLVLVERRERVVSKAELLDRVWPGVVVEENNLQVHISAL